MPHWSSGARTQCDELHCSQSFVTTCLPVSMAHLTLPVTMGGPLGLFRGRCATTCVTSADCARWHTAPICSASCQSACVLGSTVVGITCENRSWHPLRTWPRRPWSWTERSAAPSLVSRPPSLCASASALSLAAARDFHAIISAPCSACSSLPLYRKQCSEGRPNCVALLGQKWYRSMQYSFSWSIGHTVLVSSSTRTAASSPARGVGRSFVRLSCSPLSTPNSESGRPMTRSAENIVPCGSSSCAHISA
mmetsp:Transcript_10228/g.35589  ORF Transcript_10228/g.35589 Transcript_10228/m.35589 type:complete len:250 (+) Transcript_10228:265-1014(+)